MQTQYLQHSESCSPIISVVVCTYNRADLLGNVLQRLCDQNIDSMNYEVVVIDNNSRDNTRVVVDEFYHRYPTVYYYLEKKQGLSHARNRGWQVSRGMYVAFTDDDCEIPRQWLAVAKEVIEQVSPDVFGGPILALYKNSRPHWYRDEYNRSHIPFDKSKMLNKDECIFLYGGNLFIRRKLLEFVGGFNTRLGMSGGKIAYGEETLFLKSIVALAPNTRLYFDPRLYVYDIVRPDQMTIQWKIRSSFARGRMMQNVFMAGKTSGRLEIMKKIIQELLRFTKIFARGIFKRDHTKHPYYQNYLFEYAPSSLVELGIYYELWQQIPHKWKLKGKRKYVV